MDEFYELFNRHPVPWSTTEEHCVPIFAAAPQYVPIRDANEAPVAHVPIFTAYRDETGKETPANMEVEHARAVERARAIVAAVNMLRGDEPVLSCMSYILDETEDVSNEDREIIRRFIHKAWRK